MISNNEIDCLKLMNASYQGNSKVIRCFESFVSENCLELDLDKLNKQAYLLLLPYLNDIIHMIPVREIRLYYPIDYHHQSNPKQHTKTLSTQDICTVIKAITESLQNNHSKHLRSIKIENIPQISHCLEIIAMGISKSKYLKQLSIINCSLDDSNLQTLKLALSQNISLTSIDFSYNQLTQVGQAIVYILSKHGQRKNELITLHKKYHKTPQFDISNTGIYKVNLSGNQLSNNTIDEIIKHLQNDQWVKSINLKNNHLQQSEINKFVQLMEQNSTIINLDLRENPGCNKKCAKKIFYKLKQNLSKMKSKQENIQKQMQSPQFNKKHHTLNVFQNHQIKNQKPKFLVQSPQRHKNPQNRHSQQKSIDNKNKRNENQLSLFLKFSKKNQTSQTKSNNKINTTHSNNKRHSLYLNKQPLKIHSDEIIEKNCSKCCELRKKLTQAQQKCMEMQIQALKAEKQKLELEIEIKKLKSFIEKNKDLSLIGMSINKIAIQNPPQLNSQNSNISTSFNKTLGPQNDEELISRIELLVTELTRIMQTVQHFQNTQNTIQHPFSNVNSFSKTVSLYERPRQLMQIQQQILEDEALHLELFVNESMNLQQNVLGAQQSILKAGKNQITEQQSQKLINL